jgi:CelD/BcsL family acetyltransferase involved in cellulose biosynthesis
MLLTIPLKFQLGEITIFERSLLFQVDRRHFTQYSSPLTGTDSIDVSLPPDADGVMIPSRPVLGRLAHCTKLSSAICYVPNQYERFYIDMTLGMDGYLQKFSAKSRSTIKRKLKKFSEFSGGTIDWKVYRTLDELLEFHKLARDVSRHTYQETLLDAGLPEDDEFVSHMRTLASAGKVRGFLLFHSGQAIAYLYCPVEGDIVIYNYLGYRAEYAKWSPGTVLFWLALEQLFAENRFRMFDFTEGGAEVSATSHKRIFATGSQRCADILLVRRTLRNWLLVEAHLFLNTLSTSIVHALDSLGIKSAVKRFIRTFSIRARSRST